MSNGMTQLHCSQLSERIR